MNYFIVAVSYPRTEDHPAEVQALVNPEETRRDIISNIAKGEYRGEIAFIHAISGSCVEDVTRELIEAAGLPAENIHPVDLQALRNDYRRDVRKHEVV